MISNMVTTFLELGDATSRNLEFSLRKDVFVSYGEETITENNLLEIRRRHRRRICLETFPKKKEAQYGADWEWHIVGNQWTLKMRVQAKRVQRDDSLKIKYKVKSSGKQQRELLLDRAKDDKMKPLYCIYCTECQRTIWKQSHAKNGLEKYQTGCLLADANDVPEDTKKLCAIERNCIPWHYLFRGERWRDAPTIADLNGEGDGDFNPNGVHETNGEVLDRSGSPQVDQAMIWDGGIHRKLVINVRVRK